jgi:hypothetical protein
MPKALRPWDHFGEGLGMKNFAQSTQHSLDEQ